MSDGMRELLKSLEIVVSVAAMVLFFVGLPDTWNVLTEWHKHGVAGWWAWLAFTSVLLGKYGRAPRAAPTKSEKP